MSKTIIRTEVRFVEHIQRTDRNDDYHYVREDVYYSDGTWEPKIRMIKDYLRPVYVTHPNYRNHIEKKEYEDKDKLLMKECTQSDMYKVVAQMIGKPFLADRPNLIHESPYVYGLGMSSCNLIKQENLDKNNNVQSPYSIAYFDLETSTEYPKEIKMVTIVREINNRYQAHLILNGNWIKEINDPVTLIKRKFGQYFPDIQDQIDLTTVIFNDELDIVADLFKVANGWAPSFLAAWNIQFDMGEIILPLLARRGKSPLDYICDQRLPRELRRFKYEEAPDTFTTSSGVHVSKQPSDRWHKFYGTMTFRFIDGMCTYRQLRLHKPRESSYSLNATLNKEIKSNKVDIEGMGDRVGKEWHDYAQEYKKIDYITYGVGDCIEPIKLDAKNKDLSVSLPVFAGSTDFNDFGSSSRKAYTSLYEYVQRHNCILGTATNTNRLYEKYSKDKDIPNNHVYKYKVLGVDGWIQTLPNDNTFEMGTNVFKDFKDLTTMAVTNMADSDAVSSYPTCTIVSNASKSTCCSEIISLHGFDESETKEIFLGLAAGSANTLELAEEVWGLPSPEEIMVMCLNGDIEKY